MKKKCKTLENSWITIKEGFKMFNIIENATFVSIWDGGYSVETKCSVNLETKEVFDIEMLSGDELEEMDLETLDEQYIIINDNKYLVYEKDEAEVGDFWYR